MSAFPPGFDYIILISGLWGTHFCQISSEDYTNNALHSSELILYNEDLICLNNVMRFIERKPNITKNRTVIFIKGLVLGLKC